MREILFRGKRVDNGEWVYGDLVVNRPTGTYRIWVDFANVKHGDYAESQLHECSGQLFIVVPETVGQYIGLNDMEGKQIYFGDIVTDGQRNFLIKWSGQNAAFYMGHTDGKRSFYKEFIECGQSQSDGPVQCDTIKVIGNIHEPLNSTHNL